MSGAKNCPETPRQKMIGMMYLVLTAMLALNVSADIINGFTKLRHSMEDSMMSTKERTEAVYEMFKTSNETDSVKFGEWFKVAEAVYDASEDFYDYIENFKLDIAKAVDGESYKKMPDHLKNGTDTHGAHSYALNEGHAAELEEHMDVFRKYLTEATSPILMDKVRKWDIVEGDSVRNPKYDERFTRKWNRMRNMFSKLFSTDDVQDAEGNTLDWGISIFNEMPAEAVVAMLTKYQNDVRVAENELINFFYESAGASEHVVNKVEALIIPVYGDYVMQGQTYEAQIVSAMLDTTNKPHVIIDGAEVEDGYYRVAAKTVGQHTYTGKMIVDEEELTFEGHYTVGAPSAAIANMDLNMMYSGYDNIFRISVPGYGDDKLIVACAGATITHKGADWIINPAAGKEATIIVSVKENGKSTEMGRQTFRVRPLPSPASFIGFGGQETDAEKLQKKILTSGMVTVNASYGPDSPIKAKFTVESFSVKFPNGQVEVCPGNKLSAKAINLLKKVKPGQDILIRQVMAKGPDGKVRELKSMIIELQ